MIVLTIIVMAAAAFFLLSLTFKLLKRPIKWIFKFFIHACMGYIFLFIFNFVGEWVGISLGLNWVNAAITGILGIPGVILLLLIKYIII